MATHIGQLEADGVGLTALSSTAACEFAGTAALATIAATPQDARNARRSKTLRGGVIGISSVRLSFCSKSDLALRDPSRIVCEDFLAVWRRQPFEFLDMRTDMIHRFPRIGIDRGANAGALRPDKAAVRSDR